MLVDIFLLPAGIGAETLTEYRGLRTTDGMQTMEDAVEELRVAGLI